MALSVADSLFALWVLLGLGLSLLTLPGSLELLMLSLAAVLPLPKRRRPPIGAAPHHMAVVVPAHDERHNIAATVESLLAAKRPEGIRVELVVIADNCSDDTAEVAEAAGARVLVRHSEDQRGKGYALDFAFHQLMDEGAEALLVVDADTEVEPNFIEEAWMAFARGADAVQAPYSVSNPDASLRTRLMNLALLAMNVLRPRGREILEHSVGIFGNGWGVSAATLKAVPYDATSVVEDLEFHLSLVQSGRRVRFLGLTRVRGEMPSGGKGVDTQRARWEGGRLRMMQIHIPRLIREVLGGRLQLIEPLLDLMLLSLAYHVLLLGLTLLIPFGPTQAYAAFGLAVVAFHVVAAVWVGGGGLKDLLILAVVPFYILWKLSLAKLIKQTADKDADWVRTQREAEKKDGEEG